MNIVGKLVGAIVLLMLLPTIVLVLLDMVQVILASLPGWVVAVLATGAVMGSTVVVGLILRLFGLIPRRRQRHDVFHHRGRDWS